uniref:BRCT domain-containing protein n=1 Tax=Romanomermis culicivorax TaxID=13658 RepID=A0A915JG16_ROMCU
MNDDRRKTSLEIAHNRDTEKLKSPITTDKRQHFEEHQQEGLCGNSRRIVVFFSVGKKFSSTNKFLADLCTGIGGVLAESVEVINRPRSSSNASLDIQNPWSILQSKTESLRNLSIYLADNYGTIDFERNSNSLIFENNSNGLNVERYDFDNASSIASSDTDIVRHYNILRTSSRQNLSKKGVENGVKLEITPSTLVDSNSKNSLARKNRRHHNYVGDLSQGSYHSINR